MPSLLDDYKGVYSTIGDAKAAMQNGSFASANPYAIPPSSTPSAPAASTSTPSFSAHMGMTPVQPLVSTPPTVTKLQIPSIDVNGITQRITADYGNQLAAQKQAIEQELAKIQQGNALAVTQNQNALQDELNKLGQQKTLNDQTAINLQNRRGGFYSGGLDYQLGNIAKGTTEAMSQAQRDTTARNADLWSKNALAAAQAAENIKLLETQAPDKIRSLIQQEIDRQRGVNIQEAGITGQYNGAPTRAAINEDRNYNLNLGQAIGVIEDPYVSSVKQQMQKNSQDWYNASPEQQQLLADKNRGLASLIGAYQDENGNWVYPQTGTPTLAARTQNLNETQTMAALTGFLPDGTPTNAYQQQQLTNAWTQSINLGSVTPALSQLTGIPVGTPTQAAKQAAMSNAIQLGQLAISRGNQAISQQNADTAAASQKTSAERLALEQEQAGNKPQKVDVKTSTDNYNLIYEDLQTKGITKETAQKLVEANRDNLSDADYRDLNKYVRDNF